MTPVDYTTLFDPEKALAVDVKGVYPVVSVGRASDTDQLIMTCRVLALQRDVCRVPCHDGQLLASMSLWVPMFFDLLPPTSLATLQQALPQVVVNTWYTMADWLRREWSTWAPYNRLLYQAEVSDLVPVLDLQQWLHALTPVDFTKVLAGSLPLKSKSKVAFLALANALYLHWARQVQMTPLCCMAVTEDMQNVAQYVMKPEDWGKVSQGLAKEFSIRLPQDHEEEVAPRAPSTEPMWKRMLAAEEVPRAMSPAAEVDPTDMLDEVLYLNSEVIPQAVRSLQALLEEHRVDTRITKNVKSLRLPTQLHSALKHILGKTPEASKAALVTSLKEWAAACSRAAPAQVVTSDRLAFLKDCKELLATASDEVDWFDLSFRLLYELPVTDDIIPDALQDVGSKADFKRALFHLAHNVQSRLSLRCLLKSVRMVHTVPPENNNHTADTSSGGFGWFFDSPLKTAPTAPVHQSAHPALAPAAAPPPTPAQPLVGPEAPSAGPPGVLTVQPATSAAPLTKAFPASRATEVPPTHIVVRLCGMRPQHTADQYIQAMRQAFGDDVPDTLSEAQKAKGFWHVPVHRAAAEAQLEGHDTVDLSHPEGWYLRIRCKDSTGQPYTLSGKRPGGPVSDVPKRPLQPAPRSSLLPPPQAPSMAQVHSVLPAVQHAPPQGMPAYATGPAAAVPAANTSGTHSSGYGVPPTVSPADGTRTAAPGAGAPSNAAFAALASRATGTAQSLGPSTLSTSARLGGALHAGVHGVVRVLWWVGPTLRGVHVYVSEHMGGRLSPYTPVIAVRSCGHQLCGAADISVIISAGRRGQRGVWSTGIPGGCDMQLGVKPNPAARVHALLGSPASCVSCRFFYAAVPVHRFY